MPKIKRALISVFNKKGVVYFAQRLTDLGIEILSTRGTAKILKEARIPVKEVSEYTGSPPMLSGRVKTLHPKIHASLLALRDAPEQMDEVKKYNIKLIDMVVVNFYPFEEIVNKEKMEIKKALENIDIGGPTMLRSAAKNFPYVAAVSNPSQYPQILKELEENDSSLSEETSFNLAIRAFQKTGVYDSFIANYFQKRKGEEFPEIISLNYTKEKELNYGENPHQSAAFYRELRKKENTLSSAQKLSGKELSFNNLLDLDAALRIIKEFKEPAAVVIKHTNPCGAGCAPKIESAFKKAYEGDPLSAFGCIIGLNRVVDRATAERIASPHTFVQGIIAPDYNGEALRIIKVRQKWGKKLVILKTGPFSFNQKEKDSRDLRGVEGGILLQKKDALSYIPEQLKTVTQREPTKEEKEEVLFSWIICKHVKSNAIVLSKNKTVIGVGAGQTSRIDSCLIAIRKAGKKAKGSCLASDAFFPFPDVVEEAGKAGITAIIQPGGSLRDREAIKVADKYNIAMLFTGIRHFRH
ncbi:MAG: bifunctional phosphoribosylaminoimidazolecarboxamide formyltransferase/IMP cyclohydrolase [Candidatus Aerophobetes bacterium]|nr:bifunctional phosphoribosylaminoimidazolecarboxamide formyltransferase/IMP cyclohydrolase [Candidatus Aerophobetes bacterium]